MRPAGVCGGGKPPPGVRLSVWAKPLLCGRIGRVPITVLVVDDHAGFRSRARLLLEAEGFEVVGEVADGETALAEAQRLHPELVLLDVQLPELDGFDVAARITADGGAPAVVLTSSRDWSDSAELIMRCGARGFLRKDQLSGAAIGELLG
jgi:DNA-binding NarL/FixJ family response regulator